MAWTRRVDPERIRDEGCTSIQTDQHILYCHQCCILYNIILLRLYIYIFHIDFGTTIPKQLIFCYTSRTKRPITHLVQHIS